jgi:hypothetical protein
MALGRERFGEERESRSGGRCGETREFSRLDWEELIFLALIT